MAAADVGQGLVKRLQIIQQLESNRFENGDRDEGLEEFYTT